MAELVPEYAKSGAFFHYVLYDFHEVNGGELAETMEQMLSRSPINQGKYNMDVREYLEEFYVRELTTPQQCAEKIQARAEIWLNE